MASDLICHFGKHEGENLVDIPSGYLKWAIKNIDPVPLPKYRKDVDGNPLSDEEVKEMESNMRIFLSEAQDELDRRDDDGEKD